MAKQIMDATYLGYIVLTDPASGGDVEMEVYTVEGGGMFSIDSSFLGQVDIPELGDDAGCYSPFDENVILRCNGGDNQSNVRVKKVYFTPAK